jgi:cytochrome c-type biogenesis protein CcmH/NrfG
MPPAGMGMPPEVLQMLQKYRSVLATKPNDVDANVGLGNLFFDSGQWQQAVDHYQTALKSDPKNGDVRVDMGIAYHNLGNDARAKEEMERVTREQPGHVNAWFNLGIVASAMGDTKTTIHAWEHFLELDPNGERAPGIRDELNRLKQKS